MQAPQEHSFVVTVIPQAPTPQTTLGDVIVGALGLAGVLVLIALALGVVTAVLRLAWNRLRPPSDDHLPPVSPFVRDPTAPPSSQAG